MVLKLTTRQMRMILDRGILPNGVSLIMDVASLNYILDNLKGTNMNSLLRHTKTEQPVR